MEIQPLGPGFAVEVGGIDPARPISSSQADELRALLDAYGLLVLRCPGLDPEAHLRFVGLFGPIFDEARDASGLSHVSNVIGKFPSGRLLFHQDFAFTQHPHPVQSLYAEEARGGVAPTLFVSTVRAYERLTDAQRRDWAGLTAVHARDTTRKGFGDEEFARVRLRELPDGDDARLYPRASHPVIGRHPRTGAPLLFVNEYHCSHIVELPPEEGEAVIAAGCAVLYAPEGIYTHAWREGDLVVWDNLALQHARSEVRPDTRRTLRRVLVNGLVA